MPHPFDPSQWRIETSADPQQQAAIEKDRALTVAAEPIVSLLTLLGQLGQLRAAHVKPWSVTVAGRDGLRITLTISVERPETTGGEYP